VGWPGFQVQVCDVGTSGLPESQQVRSARGGTPLVTEEVANC
jgi:hypothetical protein